MGERQQTQRVASATRVLPIRAATLHAIPPPTLPRLGGGGGRGAVAHRYSSAVSSPNCDGTLPLRSLLLRNLREGRRERDHGGTATDAECGKCDARASPTRRHTRRPLGTLPWLGGGGVPRCGGSQSLQVGEQPKLRGHAAGQALAVN
eukprot:scaffold2668_cov24-Phaeocystis_antarctica.AAC.1